jgi:transcriptional regulator, ArsR family
VVEFVSLRVESVEDLVRVGRALSNPLRVRILLMLARRPTFIQDVAQSLHIPYALAHMHLKILEEAGLVEGSYVVEERPKPHLRKVYRVRDFRLVIDRELLERLAERYK